MNYSVKKKNKNGRLFIISAPSGTGKTTICKAVLKHYNDILYSISYTTRPPRQGEQDGVDYYFISKDEFLKKINEGKWAEWAEVHGNFYGTSAEYVDTHIGSGESIIFDIDVQGARQILKRYPEAVTIFIMPPSLDVLKKRLTLRETDSDEVIAERLKNAENEMAQKDSYKYVIINDQLPEAVEKIHAVIKKYRE